MFLSPRSKKQFPCNHIWREAVCERQAVMWNKCRTQGLLKKKSGVLTPYPCKPEQMVCGVSALGGRGPSLGGVGRSAHQMTSYPSIDFFFYSWFFGLAYSGELDHGQGTRACICSAQAGWWEALGKNPNRDEDTPVTPGHRLGITDVFCGDSEGRVLNSSCL